MRYFTAGESHGPELTAIIEGLPAGLEIDLEKINADLKRRQGGYGRGERMKIENDQILITSGLRHGKTLGSPLTLRVKNKDFDHWKEVMASGPVSEKVEQQRRLTRPRPGHADLVGGIKYNFSDLRNVLERSSARETTMRVAVGSIAMQLLEKLDIHLANHVVNFGGIALDIPSNLTVATIKKQTEENDLSIVNSSQAQEIRQHIDAVKKAGDTIGGIIELRVSGMPAGVGSYVHYDRKLDGKIAAAVLSINAFKGVEFGLGFEAGKLRGSQVMDPITWDKATGYQRSSNYLGGFEGGMTNGEDLIIRGAMKPIPTLYQPLISVNTETHTPYKASVERSDPTALPAAGVVMEAVIASVLAQALLEQFSSDYLTELIEAVEKYKKHEREF